jgi:hypothetical protein
MVQIAWQRSKRQKSTELGGTGEMKYVRTFRKRVAGVGRPGQE